MDNSLIRGLINSLFLGHNFWTRNTKKPIKGSKDSYHSLVSSKNLSQKLALVVGAHGPMTSAKNALTYPTYDVNHKKTKSKTFQFKKNPN